MIFRRKVGNGLQKCCRIDFYKIWNLLAAPRKADVLKRG